MSTDVTTNTRKTPYKLSGKGSSQTVQSPALSDHMSVLIAPHLIYVRAAGMAATAIAARRRILMAADTAMPCGIDEATTEECATWLAGPPPPHEWKPWTRATYFGHLNGFYLWATGGDDSELDYNPCAKLKRPKGGEADPNPVTQQELEAALARSPFWWQLPIILAAFGGLRVSDIVSLRREDVTPDWLTVRHGKGDKTLRVPTHPTIWSAVRIAARGLLVTSPKLHRPIKADNLSVLARRHFDKIGMPDVHMHRFRDYFATMLLEGGVDLLTASKLMRHANTSTMAHYALVSPQRLRAGIDVLPVVGGQRSKLIGRQHNTVQIRRRVTTGHQRRPVTTEH